MALSDREGMGVSRRELLAAVWLAAPVTAVLVSLRAAGAGAQQKMA